MSPNTAKKAIATRMWWFHTTRMARVMMSVVMNMTNVTATPAGKKKKQNVFYTSSSQLRADQASKSPWWTGLYKDQIDVTYLEPMSVKHPATGDP